MAAGTLAHPDQGSYDDLPDEPVVVSLSVPLRLPVDPTTYPAAAAVQALAPAAGPETAGAATHQVDRSGGRHRRPDVAPIQTTASPTRSTAPPLRSSPSPARTAAVAQAKETAFIAGRAAVLVFVVVAALLFASEVFWGTLR